MLLPHPFQKKQTLLSNEVPLTSMLSTKDLPPSYWTLLETQNGGYVRDFVMPTEEPTSDGLDHANLHYIFGLHECSEGSLLHQQEIREQAQLPDYFIIFSINGTQMFAFDYSQRSLSGEPAIRYLDVETDNWQTIAPDFPSFLAKLEPGKISIPPDGQLSQLKAEHAFLLMETAEDLSKLFLHLETTAEKTWYLRWLNHFTNHPDNSFRSVALDALETQILYFRRELPASTQSVLEQFLQETDGNLQEKAKRLLTEWQQPYY